MKASPIQWALCVTCLLLLLAKVWDWWQGLGQRAAAPWAPGGRWDDEAAFPQSGSLQVGLPLSVVAPEIAGVTEASVLAREPAHDPVSAPQPVAAFVHDGVIAPAAIAQEAAVLAPAFVASGLAMPDPAPPTTATDVLAQMSVPAEPAPEPPPSSLQPPASQPPSLPASQPPDDPEPVPAPDPESSHDPSLAAHLTDLATRELVAARLRAKSMLVNAEEQVRAILEEAERMATAVTEQAAALPRPTGPDVSESRRQGVREGHAIGLRKGEMEALARIEQVFAQIESLLDAVPRTTSSGGLPPGRQAW